MLNFQIFICSSFQFYLYPSIISNSSGQLHTCPQLLPGMCFHLPQTSVVFVFVVFVFWPSQINTFCLCLTPVTRLHSGYGRGSISLGIRMRVKSGKHLPCFQELILDTTAPIFFASQLSPLELHLILLSHTLLFVPFLPTFPLPPLLSSSLTQSVGSASGFSSLILMNKMQPRRVFFLPIIPKQARNLVVV